MHIGRLKKYESQLPKDSLPIRRLPTLSLSYTTTLVSTQDGEAATHQNLPALHGGK